MKRILIVHKDVSLAEDIYESLGREKVNVEFTDDPSTGTARAVEGFYDLIILGDDNPSKRGDAYDVGMEIKNSKKNKRTLSVCVNSNPTKKTKLHSLLTPNSIRADYTDREKFMEQLATWLKL